MAGSNDSAGGWQIATFVMLLPLGLALFGTYSGFQQAQLEAAAKNAALANERDSAGKFKEQDAAIQQLKGLIGFNSNELVGSQTAVFEQTQKAMSTSAGDLIQPTVDATLQAMAAEIQRLKAEVAQHEANINTRDTTLAGLQAAYQNRVDEAVGSQRDSEQELQRKVREMEDNLASKDEEVDQWRKSFETAQIEKTEIADTLDQVTTVKDEEIANLRRRVKQLGDELRDVTDTSFEVADGLVRSVDAVQGICTINLGSLDGLPVQTTFSVYKKNNAGIGRGIEDVKGSIEVVRVLGPHHAEARILEQDVYDPISPADPIYSPLWQEGQIEHFVFVGKMDVNLDGTDDRDLLFRIVENAGAEIDFYVGDEPTRVPADGKISERTKFVVVGELADPSDFANRDERYQNARDILTMVGDIDNEADQYGTRTISLPDFLNYMGYKPTQRSYRPGSGAKYLLKTGREGVGQKSDPLRDSLPKK